VQIVHLEYINAKEAVYVELPDELSDTCRTALKRIGISKLYSHQVLLLSFILKKFNNSNNLLASNSSYIMQDEAIRASLSGKNIVVATSTSSGKSLCYNVPVLEELSMNPSSCALYIFPTKVNVVILSSHSLN